MGLIKKAIQEGEIIVPYEPTITPTGGRCLEVISTTGENLFDNTFKKNCTHFRNKFTVAIWAKTSASDARHFEARVAGNAQRFALGCVTNPTTLRVQLRDSGNTLEKDWRTTISASVWNHIVVAVNKSKSEQLKVFLNGVKVTSFTKTVDLSLSSRKNISITNVFATQMRFYSLAVWNRMLRDQDIPAIYNNGNETFNLRVNSNGYGSRKYLQHWFIPEANTTSDNAMGIDYGKAYKDGMNLMDGASLVTVLDDLQVDSPSGR